MVNIIIPTFNGLKWLEPLYIALKKGISPDVETTLTIVDDGSTDATEAWALKHPDVNYVKQQVNLGFAKACNRGARSIDSDYVLFLNNDTEPLPGFLEEMLKVAQKAPHPGIVGAKLLFPDKKRVEHGGLGFTAAGFPFDIFRGRDRNDPNVTRTRSMDAVTAACMLVKRDLFNRLGGFYEGFINGWEDSVTGDTPILIKEDKFIDIIPIEDLYSDGYDSQGHRKPIKDIEVYSRQGWSEIKYCYKHKIRKKIFDIITQTGRVKVTQDHSLFQDGQPILVEKLNIGDKIDSIEIPRVDIGLKTCTEDFAWALGLFVAEGTAKQYQYKFKNYQWKIDNTNIALLEKAKTIMESCFCQPCKIYKYRSKDRINPVYRLRILGKKEYITNFFFNLCYTQKSHFKKVPKLILNGNLGIKNAFLNGYWAGDGHVEQRGNSIRRSCVSNSMTLIAGVQYLLRNFGKHSSVLTRKDKPNVTQLRILEDTVGSNQSEKKPSKYDVDLHIRKKELCNFKETYVYDIETKDHTFVVALGGVVAHNSDFCLRAKQLGSQIFYCAEAEVIHFLYGSDSEGRFFHEKDNKLLYQDRWIHHRKVNVIAPFWMAIAATWDCNLRCKHCNIWQGRNARRFPGEINTIDFQTFIAHDFYSNIINVAIFGGEPTMHSKLVDLIAICATRWPGQEIGIVTNGMYFRDNQKYIWETVKNNLRGNFVVRVSIDGREKVHDELRGVKGSFEEAIQTAKFVNTLWPGVGGISITVYPETIDELSYLIEFVEKLGIKFCIRAGVSGSYFDGEANENWRPEQIERLREIIMGTPSSLFVFDRFAKSIPDFLEKGEHSSCEAFRKTLVVNTDLMVSACHNLPPLGHLRDIPAIWGRTKEWCQMGIDCLTDKCFKRNCHIDGPWSVSLTLD